MHNTSSIRVSYLKAKNQSNDSHLFLTSWSSMSITVWHYCFYTCLLSIKTLLIVFVNNMFIYRDHFYGEYTENTSYQQMSDIIYFVWRFNQMLITNNCAWIMGGYRMSFRYTVMHLHFGATFFCQEPPFLAVLKCVIPNI